MSEWNFDLDAAPYQKVVEVMNGLMDRPVLATRGYTSESGAVHPNQRYFTLVRDPDTDSLTTGRPGGLVCPDRWRTPSNTEGK